jgi:hypothetical protein
METLKSNDSTVVLFAEHTARAAQVELRQIHLQRPPYDLPDDYTTLTPDQALHVLTAAARANNAVEQFHIRCAVNALKFLLLLD